MLHNLPMEATMAELTSVDDMTIPQGGGNVATAPVPADNPFAAFKNEVSSDEQTRLDTTKAAAAPDAAAKAVETAAAEAAAAEAHENVIAEDGTVETPPAKTAETTGKSKFQQRIDQLKRAETDANTRAERAEAALAEERRTKKTATTPSTTDAKSWKNDPTAPKADDFPFGEVDPDFIVALADWRFEQRSAQQAEVDKTNSARSAAEAEASKVNDKWLSNVAKAEEKLTDFADVVLAQTPEGGPKWACSAAMSRLIKSSDVGPQVAYYLAKNPAEAQRLFALPVVEQGVEFGALKTKFAPGAVLKVVPGAPPPPKDTATGKGGTPPSASSSSDFAAFEAQVKAQKTAASSGRR